MADAYITTLTTLGGRTGILIAEHTGAALNATTNRADAAASTATGR